MRNTSKPPNYVSTNLVQLLTAIEQSVQHFATARILNHDPHVLGATLRNPKRIRIFRVSRVFRVSWGELPKKMSVLFAMYPYL